MPYALPPAEAKLPFFRLLKGAVAGEVDFAQRLHGYLGVEKCLLANSGKSLLYLLLRWLSSRGSSGRDEVLIPGYTCYSVAAAVVKAGLKVVLYDLDPATFQPDLQDIKRKIGVRSLAVVGQHLFGMPSDMGRLAVLAREHGVCVIEDSAQAFGAGKKGSPEGMVADFSFFSFGRGKPLPLGCGGALIARDVADLDRLCSENIGTAHGKVNFLVPFAVQIFSRPHLYWILEKLPLGLGRTIYDPGFIVSAMPSFYQRIGTAVLQDLVRLNRHRAMIGRVYLEYFQADIARAEAVPCFTRFPVFVENRNALRLLTAYGVRQMYPLALCDLPALHKNLAQAMEKTPGARHIAEHLITLPTHLSVDRRMAELIAREVEEHFRMIKTVSLVNGEK